MKTKLMKLGILAVCGLMVAVLLGGCTNGGNKGADSGGKVKLTIMSADAGRVVKQDDPVVAEVEKLTNTDIELMLVPAAEFLNKFNTLVASNSSPDIVRHSNYDFFSYVPQKIFIELNDLIDSYGINMKKNIPEEAWKISSLNGKYYAVPGYNWSGKYNTIVRQDWLNKFDMKAPTNLEELREMYKKFTYDDPDGNGKNDTYGISTAVEITVAAIPETFMPIYGAYGIMPGYYAEKDGKVYPASITGEYKQALEYITKLYLEDKVVDPDLFLLKTDQARQNLVQGRAGSFTSWWSTTPQALIDNMKMKTVNPESELVIIPPVKGANGEYGYRASGILNASASISSNCKNPEAAIKLLDFFASDDGAVLVTRGIKDVHYIEKDGKFAGRTEDGKKAMDEKWLDSLSQIVPRTDVIMGTYEVNDPLAWEHIEKARDSKLYYDLFEGITTSESQKYLADIKKLELEWFTKFITGKEPISKFDEYVNTWLTKGGRDILKSMTDEYNLRNGTDFVPAFQ